MIVIAVSAFILCWIFLLIYVVVGNFLYLAVVLPALRRDGLDGSVKFTPSQQLKQVDLFVARHSADESRPWYLGTLSRARTLSAVLAFLMIAVGVLMFFSL
jgi:hypothetical protein